MNMRSSAYSVCVFSHTEQARKRAFYTRRDPMKNITKIFFILLTVFLVLTCITACGNGTPDGNDTNATVDTDPTNNSDPQNGGSGNPDRPQSQIHIFYQNLVDLKRPFQQDFCFLQGIFSIMLRLNCFKPLF